MPEDGHPIDISSSRSYGKENSMQELKARLARGEKIGIDPSGQMKRSVRSNPLYTPKDVFQEAYEIGYEVFTDILGAVTDSEYKGKFKTALLEGVRLGFDHAQEKKDEEIRLTPADEGANQLNGVDALALKRKWLKEKLESKHPPTTHELYDKGYTVGATLISRKVLNNLNEEQENTSRSVYINGFDLGLKHAKHRASMEIQWDEAEKT